MKLTLQIGIGGTLFALGMVFALWLADPGTRCETITAGYEQTHALYEQRLAQQDETLRYALARVATAQDQVKVLRVAHVASTRAKAETIEQLAARVAPVEKAIKQEVVETHEFIPAALRGYWGKVLQYGLMRGK